jgi:hypothetical protein
MNKRIRVTVHLDSATYERALELVKQDIILASFSESQFFGYLIRVGIDTKTKKLAKEETR